MLAEESKTKVLKLTHKKISNSKINGLIKKLAPPPFSYIQSKSKTDTDFLPLLKDENLIPQTDIPLSIRKKELIKKRLSLLLKTNNKKCL